MGKQRKAPTKVKGAVLSEFSFRAVHTRLGLPTTAKYHKLYRPKKRNEPEGDGSGKEKSLRDIVDLLERECDCTPTILLCQKGRPLAYHFLTAAINQLHQLAEQPGVPDPPQPAEADDSPFVRRACGAFGAALGTDCWVAFVRNRRINRSHFFDSHGLHVPQATHGFLWKNDLPTRRLFDSTDLLQLHDRGPEAESGGTFRLREDIESRTLSVRVEGERLTLVVFCNWRGATRLTGDMKKFWDLVEGARTDAERTLALNILAPAARYFAGYLTGSGAEVTDGSKRAEENITAKLVKKVWGAIARRAGSDDGKLEHAIQDALHMDIAADPKIHRVEELPDGSSRVLISDPEDYEVDEAKVRDDCLKYSTRSNDPRKLVAESICAQAVAWNVSLLVDFRELESKRNRSTMEDHLLKIRVARKPKHDHELAVPLRDADGKIGAVIGLSSRSKLESKHVRRVELLMQLCQQLRAIHGCDNRDAIKFVRQLAEFGERPGTSFQNVAKCFNEWVLRLLDADLVYLSLYHAAHDVFRMMGVSIDRRLLRAWIEHPNEVNTFLGTFEDVSALRSLLQQMEQSSDAKPAPQDALLLELLLRLLEHALITRLRPRRSPTRARGLTWEIFTGARKPPFVFDDPAELVPSARYYTKTIYARPFAATPESRPDGVLWVGWQKKPAPSLVSPAGGQLSDAAKEAVLQQVQQLVAVIYAMFQYYDPDEALDPLPFRRAK
jgi:hypothetical protein